MRFFPAGQSLSFCGTGCHPQSSRVCRRSSQVTVPLAVACCGLEDKQLYGSYLQLSTVAHFSILPLLPHRTEMWGEGGRPLRVEVMSIFM